MKAIIVDDEPKAIELIESYLIHFPQVKILSTFRNGLKALGFLKDNPVDLVFLDINMPHLSGLALSKLIGPDVMLIFITAHAEHAPESYEVEAVDYLMKPVSFERFTKAIHKALKNKPGVPAATKPNEIINLRSEGNIYRVPASNIYFLEKAANYMAYHTTEKKLLVRQSVAEALKELPADFIQTHKSFIVNSNRVDYYNREELTINDVKIPIGNMHRESFFQMFLKRQEK